MSSQLMLPPSLWSQPHPIHWSLGGPPSHPGTPGWSDYPFVVGEAARTLLTPHEPPVALAPLVQSPEPAQEGMSALEKGRLYYEVALGKVERQDAVHRDVEAKAGRTVAASIAVYGASIAIFRLSGVTDELAHPLSEPLVWLGLAATLCFVVSLVCNFRALWPDSFYNNPDLEHLKKYMITDPRWESFDWYTYAGDSLANAYKHNKGLTNKKGGHLKLSQSFVTGMLLLTAAMAVVAAIR